MARTERVLGRGRFLPNGDGSARARLRTTSRAVLPSSRALVGALLLAISGVATFTAWQGASADDGQSALDRASATIAALRQLENLMSISSEGPQRACVAAVQE